MSLAPAFADVTARGGDDLRDGVVDGQVVAGQDRQYSLTRLPGWLQRVDGPGRTRPPRLSRQELSALSGPGLARYNDTRAVWHANLGPIRTPQLLDLHEHLAEIVEANRQDGDKNKPAALVDAYPGLGKTTAVLDYAATYHRQQVLLRGPATPDGHRRVPVAYIALTGNTHVKGLNQAICRFYGLPTAGNADTLAARAVDAVLSLGTQVFVIDDVHFLDMRRRDAQAMANHLKFLSNAFPVTGIYIGVGVAARGLLREGTTTAEALFAQFGPGANSYRRKPTPAIADPRSTRTANTEPWNPLTVALPSPIRRFLHDQAQHLLRRHHLDEPLTWRPPPPPNPPAPWPGLDPTTVDPDRFARAFTRHANDASGLRRISEATGLSDVHARLYTQIIDLEMPEEQWDNLAGHAHDGLGPADLKHLYQDRELSILNVARLSLTTQRVVRDTLTSHGITPQANRAQQIHLSREWFQENYLNTPHALRQVAALTGYSLATLTKRAAEHGIPTSRRAAPYNPFASWPPSEQPPQPVTAACSGPRGIEYVRQVLHMPGHPTQHAAAASLGIADSVLARHRKHVEHTAGIRLFHLEPGSPITPTSEGADFIHHATRALNHHDERQKRS